MGSPEKNIRSFKIDRVVQEEAIGNDWEGTRPEKYQVRNSGNWSDTVSHVEGNSWSGPSAKGSGAGFTPRPKKDAHRSR